MRSFPLLVVASIIVILNGCSPAAWNQAERSYKAGDMVSAVRYAAQTLREKPGYADAVDFLKRELAPAYEDYYARARRAEGANDWDEAFALYSDIQAMSDAVQGLPPQKHEDTGEIVTFPAKNVDKELQAARQNAAESHYQAAVSYERQKLAKDAAKEFSKSLDYINGYKDAAQRYETNRQAAVERVAVMPFDNLSGKDYYGQIGTVVADRVISEAMRDRKNLEFMEFVSREKIDELIRELKFQQTTMVDPSSAAQIGKLLGIHAFVFGKINSISTDYPPETISSYEEHDEISQGKDRPKKRVQARITVITRRAVARFDCSYQIIDVARGTIVKSGNVPRVEGVDITFGRYKGDHDALSSRSRELCQRPEAYPPPDDALVNRAAQSAAQELAAEIAEYFR